MYHLKFKVNYHIIQIHQKIRCLESKLELCKRYIHIATNDGLKMTNAFFLQEIVNTYNTR